LAAIGSSGFTATALIGIQVANYKR